MTTAAQKTNGYFMVAATRAEFDRMVIDYLTGRAKRGDKIIHARRTWMLDGDYPAETTTKRTIKRDFEQYKLDVRIYKVGTTYHAYSAGRETDWPKAEPKPPPKLTVNRGRQTSLPFGPWTLEPTTMPARRPAAPQKPRKPQRDPFMDVKIPDDIL